MVTAIVTAVLVLGKVPEARDRPPAMFAGIAVAVTGIVLAALAALTSSALATTALAAAGTPEPPTVTRPGLTSSPLILLSTAVVPAVCMPG